MADNSVEHVVQSHCGGRSHLGVCIYICELHVRPDSITLYFVFDSNVLCYRKPDPSATRMCIVMVQNLMSTTKRVVKQ